MRMTIVQQNFVAAIKNTKPFSDMYKAVTNNILSRISEGYRVTEQEGTVLYGRVLETAYPYLYTTNAYFGEIKRNDIILIALSMFKEVLGAED